MERWKEGWEKLEEREGGRRGEKEKSEEEEETEKKSMGKGEERKTGEIMEGWKGG